MIEYKERYVVTSSSDDIDDVASLLMSAFRSDYDAMVDLDSESTLELMKDTWSILDTEGETFLLLKEGDEVLGLAHLQWGPRTRLWAELPKRDLYQKYGRRNTNRFFMGKRAFQMDLDDGDCYLAHLAVSEEHRGEGIGTALLNASREFAADNGFSRLTLIVSEKNPNARKLYQREGFETTDVKYGLLEKIMFDDPLWRHMAAPVMECSFPSS